MASYTIEDIELIRRKSGISYQEAVALLDYHNGNVARALVDLERNGRIKNESAQPKRERTSSAHKGRSSLANFFSRLYQFRLKVKKENIVIANVSLLFALLALLISPHLLLISAIIILVLGYKVSFDKQDGDFAASSLEKMVRNAADNVKSTVSDFAKNFEDDRKEAPKADADDAADARSDLENAARDLEKEADRSYYQSNPAATSYHTTYNGSAPTIQVPVQVETQDGSVNVEQDSDGYTSATIE